VKSAAITDTDFLADLFSEPTRITAKNEVHPPCITPVPKPLIREESKLYSVVPDSKNEIFSTRENPAPTANPYMAASIMNPIFFRETR